VGLVSNTMPWRRFLITVLTLLAIDSSNSSSIEIGKNVKIPSAGMQLILETMDDCRTLSDNKDTIYEHVCQDYEKKLLIDKCEAKENLEDMANLHCPISLLSKEESCPDESEDDYLTKLGDSGCLFAILNLEKACGKTLEEIMSHGCLITLKPLITTECRSCILPLRVDEDTKFQAKKLCDGELSINTVHKQKCVLRSDGKSTCMMGGEGYSFCDVEYLFYRDGQWLDWDLCSLCTVTDTSRALSTSGYTCNGVCTNTWDNSIMQAPRCKVENRGPDDDEYDYCTTCTDGCPTVVVDKRPGKDVKTYLGGENKRTSTLQQDGDTIINWSNENSSEDVDENNSWSSEYSSEDVDGSLYSDSDQTDYDSDQSVDPDAYDHYSSLNSLEMEWN